MWCGVSANGEKRGSVVLNSETILKANGLSCIICSGRNILSMLLATLHINHSSSSPQATQRAHLVSWSSLHAD